MKRALILLLCLCLLTALGETRVLVIETTDIHGYIMDVSAGSADRIQYRLARIAFLINRARESGEYDGVLLLDGGDLYQGAPVSLMTGGAVIRAALDRMIDRWIVSEHEYAVRFAIKMRMDHFLDDAFSPEILEQVAAVQREEYYIRMMQAWFFATALAKQYEAALPYLEQNRLETWVHNKTIQKAVESYRIAPEQKAYLKTLRRKAERR